MKTSAATQRKPSAAPVAETTRGLALQRKCACGAGAGLSGECADCNGKKLRLQRRASAAPAGPQPQAIPPAVHETLREAGQPLDAATRAFMEARLGHDFSRVRVHADARAGESARAVNALGYTVGEHVVFAAGRYEPHTASGRKLLAHELAHVTQQRVPELHAKAAHAIGETGDALEREADAMADAVAAGRSTARVQYAARAGTLHRQPRTITRIDVHQAGSQQVGITWNDGARESHECSTGKGHCCFDESVAEGGVCSAAGSQVGDTNCTPVGTFRVTTQIADGPTTPKWWTQFVDSRSIALHEYAPVDGTPLSHGCVRLKADTAEKIFRGAVSGSTIVQVHDLAQPRCDHPALQREWMGDFGTAGATPPDGDRIDPVTQQRRSAEELRSRAQRRRSIQNEREALESALGANEAGLDTAIGALRGPTQDFRTFADPAVFARDASRGGREALTARIPRCVPTRTVEEAREPTAQAQGLASAPAQLQPMRRALERSRNLAQARALVRQSGQALWNDATQRAQGAAHDTDDRTLYWARLQMTELIRQFNAPWTRETRGHNPDAIRREREDLLHIFEQASRGMESAAFDAADAGMKRIVVSGFDPFNLDTDVHQGNPSGAAALALDGRELRSTDGGVRGRVQAVMFPVRYNDFDAGILENAFRPYLTGDPPVDLILTISMGGGPDTELETIAGRRRSSFAEDNARRHGNPEEWSRTPQSRQAPPPGGQPLPPEIPGVGSGPEFLRTNMLQPGTATFGGQRTTTLRPTSTLSAMHHSLGRVGGRIAFAEQSVWEIRPGQTEAELSLLGPTDPGSRAFTGSGGGYLSNEIYYRTLQLRQQSGATTQAIHVHTPLLSPGAPSADRDRIVATVEGLIVAALPTL